MKNETPPKIRELMIHDKDILTTGGLADLLGVHPDTIRRWADKGKIKFKKHPINGYRIFNLNDFECGNGN